MARGKIASATLKVLEQFEGRRDRAYLDTAGWWTIGIGHKVLPNEMAKYVGTPVTLNGQKRGSIVITDEEIDRLAAQDTAVALAGVERLVLVPLTENQRAALVSFAYNLGVGALSTSTLLRMLNSGDYAGAAGQFKFWNKETKNGVKVANPGLTTRRLAEATMFAADIA